VFQSQLQIKHGTRMSFQKQKYKKNRVGHSIIWLYWTNHLLLILIPLWWF